MRLERLSLRGFRNYGEFSASFVPGVNLIVGDNAQGKTNLLESIVYLSSGRSFRTRKERELIRRGADFAELEAEVFARERQQSVRALLFPDRRPRRLFLGGVRQRSASEFTGLFSTVLFCPDDLIILKTGASARRRQMDAALCQLRPGYDRALREYGRLHDHKSRILRGRREEPRLLELLPDFNLRMAQTGAALIYYRARYLSRLDELTGAFHREFSGGREALSLRYQTVSTVADPFAAREVLADWLLEHQKNHERAELETGQCLSGPHRDDFDLTVDGASLKSFGSQGQIRTAAISLKLAEREIFRKDAGEEPVLLLDDVLSELDAGRQDFLLNRIREGQVFITCCEKERLTSLGKTYLIENGKLVS